VSFHLMSNDCRLFVARISTRTRTRDLEDLFGRYGRLRDVVIKQGYAFVEYEDGRDAKDASKELDGYKLDGERIAVEFSRRRGDDRERGGGRGRREDRFSDRRPPPRGGGRFTPPHNTDYRLLARNLPARADWKDLKDFFRDAGRVCFTDVRRDRDGTEVGVVEFESQSDLENAIKKLDGSKMHGSALQLINDYKAGASSSARGHSKSRSRSPRRSASPRKSRSRSPRKSGSPSPDRKRSRSPIRKRSRSASPTQKRSPVQNGSRSASPKPSPKRSQSPEKKDE